MTRRFWTDLWYLLLFIAVGFIIVFALTLITSSLTSPLSTVSLHVMQWEQNLIAFILPVLCWVHWYLKRPVFETLGLHRARPIHFLVAIVSILVLSIPMDWFAAWAKDALPWPDALRQMAEDEAQQQETILSSLLANTGPSGWIENVLLMSIVTAIAEEFVFRGALLSCFRRANISQHLTAVLIGLIFALIHFDLYGLLPRWILGSLFCYLFFWSGSLWPPIAAHAVNNLMALIQYKNGELF